VDQNMSVGPSSTWSLFNDKIWFAPLGTWLMAHWTWMNPRNNLFLYLHLHPTSHQSSLWQWRLHVQLDCSLLSSPLPWMHPRTIILFYLTFSSYDMANWQVGDTANHFDVTFLYRKFQYWFLRNGMEVSDLFFPLLSIIWSFNHWSALTFLSKSLD